MSRLIFEIWFRGCSVRCPQRTCRHPRARPLRTAVPTAVK
jgi:hypothetical protein